MASSSLASLRDIHLPPQPLLLSVLDGVLVAAVVAALVAIFWWSHRYLFRRRLRLALGELAALEEAYRDDSDTTRLARGVSQLLRRYAIALAPHSGVEAVTGTQWLSLLDSYGGNGAFTHGVGAALEARPYQPSGEMDVVGLLTLARRWLKANPQ
jgi:hypothetical protein